VEIGYIISAGPIPNDDYIIAQVTDGVGNSFPLGYHVTADGNLTGVMLLGRFDFGVIHGIAVGLADNDSFAMNIYQFHAGGTLVQGSATRTFHWDAVSGLWTVLGNAAALSEILQAVSVTFPPTT
jgi:hypothetical protein